MVDSEWIVEEVTKMVADPEWWDAQRIGLKDTGAKKWQRERYVKEYISCIRRLLAKLSMHNVPLALLTVISLLSTYSKAAATGDSKSLISNTRASRILFSMPWNCAVSFWQKRIVSKTISYCGQNLSPWIDLLNF